MHRLAAMAGEYTSYGVASLQARSVQLRPNGLDD
jgi:hypothetical protein